MAKKRRGPKKRTTKTERELLARMIALSNSGMSYRAISKLEGMPSPTVICRRIKAHNQPKTPPRSRKPPLPGKPIEMPRPQPPSEREEVKVSTGSRRGLGKDFIRVLAADFEKNGLAAITRLREEDLPTYCRLVSSMLPKQQEIRVPILEQLNAMTEQQLKDRIAQLEANEIAELSHDEIRERIQRLERVIAGPDDICTETGAVKKGKAKPVH